MRTFTQQPESVQTIGGIVLHMEADDYNVEHEIETNRWMLEEVIPKRLVQIYRLLDENSRILEDWHKNVMTKLILNVDWNCRELLRIGGHDSLPAAAWIARNLLEIWIWVKYCSVSADNARRFHEDALRDMKGLSDTHQLLCDLCGIRDETSAIRQQRLKEVASRKLGLDEIDANYLTVNRAAKADGVNLFDWHSPFNRFLSKFTHPTAGLVIGIMHQEEKTKDMQCVCTTHGIYFAIQSIDTVERLMSAQE